MNIKVIIIFYFTTTILNAQKTENPFLKLAADSVVFYDFGGPRATELSSIVDKNGNLSYTVKKSVKLDHATANSFTTKLCYGKSFGGNVAACFEPHLGVVYYKNKKRVAYLNICLSCNRLNSSIYITAQDQGKEISDDGHIYYTLQGMSKKFRLEINSLLKKYNFSHQVEADSMFD